VELNHFFLLLLIQEWIYVLNKGSQINISYSVNSPNYSIFLIIAEGKFSSRNCSCYIPIPFHMVCKLLTHYKNGVSPFMLCMQV
jgi:hypothetical protein